MTREEYMRIADESRARQDWARMFTLSNYSNAGQFFTDLDRGFTQTVLGLGSGAALEAPAGLAGISALGGGMDASANAIQNVQNMGYQPTSDVAQRAMGNIGSVFQPLADATDWAGRNTAEVTGSPAAGALVKSIGEGAVKVASPVAALKRLGQMGGNALPINTPGARGQAGAAHLLPPGGPPDVPSVDDLRMGELRGMPGTQLPVTRGNTRMRGGRERSAYAGVYGDPKSMVEEVNVAPESPYLRGLDTTRAELSQIAHGRESTMPEWMPDNMTEGGKGSATAHRISTPSNANRIGNIINAAREHNNPLYEGMSGWYVSDPLYQYMINKMGMSPQEAYGVMYRKSLFEGNSSPGSAVEVEMNRGSRADAADAAGRFDLFKDIGGAPNERMKPGVNRDPYLDYPFMEGLQGHPYHSTSHIKPMEHSMATGSTGRQAKVPAYITQYMPGTDTPILLRNSDIQAVTPHTGLTLPEGGLRLGMQNHFPAGDAHFARAMGLSDVRAGPRSGAPDAKGASASMTEMKTIQPWMDTELRERTGLPPGMQQPVLWGSASKQTGVKTGIDPDTGEFAGLGAPKLELMMNMVAKRAKELGMDNPQGRDRVLREYLLSQQSIGNIDPALLGMLGAGAGAAASAPLWSGIGQEEQ